jgi:hypothetical protein
MTAYDQYFAGELTNYSLSDEDLAGNLNQLEKII